MNPGSSAVVKDSKDRMEIIGVLYGGIMNSENILDQDFNKVCIMNEVSVDIIYVFGSPHVIEILEENHLKT